jgi:hypothetical protein
MHHLITYTCPVCERRIDRDVDYIDPTLFKNPEEACVTIYTWCPKCSAIHEYCISINVQKNGEYRISTSFFLCNKEKVNRRLRLKGQKDIDN